MDGASICGYPLSASRSIISHVSPDGVVMSKVLPNQGLVELQEWMLSILNLEEFDIYQYMYCNVFYLCIEYITTRFREDATFNCLNSTLKNKEGFCLNECFLFEGFY